MGIFLIDRFVCREFQTFSCIFVSMLISICYLCKLINHVSSKSTNFESRKFFSKLGPLVWQLSYDHLKKVSSSLQTDSKEIIPKTQSVPRISLLMFYTKFKTFSIERGLNIILYKTEPIDEPRIVVRKSLRNALSIVLVAICILFEILKNILKPF